MNVQMLKGSASAVKAVINGTTQLEEALDGVLTSHQLVKLTTEELSVGSNEWLASAAVWRAFAAARRGDLTLALDYVAWAMEVSAKAGAAAADAAFVAGEDTPSDFWGATYKSIAEADPRNAEWLQGGGYAVMQDLRTRAVKLPDDHAYDVRVEAAMSTAMVRSLYMSLASAGAMSRIFRTGKEHNARVMEVARELLPNARRTMAHYQLRCPDAEEQYVARVDRTISFSLVAQLANAFARGWAVHPKLAALGAKLDKQTVTEVCEFFMGLPLEDDAGVAVVESLFEEIGAKLDKSKDREALLRDRAKRFANVEQLWLFIQNPTKPQPREYRAGPVDSPERIELENDRLEKLFEAQQAVASARADLIIPRAKHRAAQRMRIAAEESLKRFQAQAEAKYAREKSHWAASGQELSDLDRAIYRDTMQAIYNSSQFKDDMDASLFIDKQTIAYAMEQERKAAFQLKMLEGKLEAAEWTLDILKTEQADERAWDRSGGYAAVRDIAVDIVKNLGNEALGLAK